jgi:predicted nucleic-acid-binding protein
VKRYIIDTNALISFVTDRNPHQQQRVAEIFKDAAGMKGLVLCPQNVLTEFVYVLDKVYGVPKQDINMMAKDFMAMPGIEMIHEVDFDTVLSYWPESIADFGDAIIASLGKIHKGSIIMTFDLKFINTLKRLGLNVHKL